MENRRRTISIWLIFHTRNYIMRYTRCVWKDSLVSPPMIERRVRTKLMRCWYRMTMIVIWIMMNMCEQVRRYRTSYVRTRDAHKAMQSTLHRVIAFGMHLLQQDYHLALIRWLAFSQPLQVCNMHTYVCYEPYRIEFVDGRTNIRRQRFQTRMHNYEICLGVKISRSRDVVSCMVNDLINRGTYK